MIGIGIGFLLRAVGREIYEAGKEDGVSSGYLAGMNAKKPRPKVIVITPRCTDIPMLRADSLWRL